MKKLLIVALLTLAACNGVQLEKPAPLTPCGLYIKEMNSVNDKLSKGQLTSAQAQAAKADLENSPNRKACYAN